MTLAMIKILTRFIIFYLSCTAVFAKQFTIENIEIDGLERISEGTVFNYIPLRVGDEMTPAQAKNIIRALYKSKYFSDVSVESEGNTLVLIVKERPAISQIEFTGNQDLDSEELIKSLRQIGFAEGQVFEKAILDRVKLELQRQYFSRGKYGVKIESTVTELSNNRVAILITMEEGIIATISDINIVGNQLFSEETLLNQFESSTGSMLSFITKDNQYSRQKLSADLETLRSFYLDRGFVDFIIESTQVTITEDKKSMFITINITEGERYKINEVRLAGNLLVPEKELFELITIKKEAIFSRKEVSESSRLLTNRFGNDGYAFANVNAVPKLDREKNEVILTFYIDPGRRAYVRRINIEGNSKTRDEVIRREFRQQEAAWIATDKVEQTKTRLQRIGYFEDVTVDTVPVAGTNDQVDLDFTVIEQSSGTLSAGLGFSQSDGLLINANLSQQNFLGSGKFFSFGFNNSDTRTAYSIGYSDPFITLDGISRGFNLFLRETDSNASNSSLGSYRTDAWGGSVNYGIPISEDNRIGLALGYTKTDLTIPTDSTIQSYIDFVEREGNTFDTYTTTLSWGENTRNHALLPTRGKLQRLTAELALPIDSLQFYRLTYEDRRYVPLTGKYTLAYGGKLGYADGYGSTSVLPFFENFYAGGQRSVRGFQANTLGVKESDLAVGGNLLVTGGMEVIFPLPFIDKPLKSFRFSAFTDIGNVYSSEESFDASLLRYSTGLSAIWISPFGPVSLSFAKPFNQQNDDDTEFFQFAVGSSF